MKVNLPDDLLPEEESPKTFREYSEWQSTEKSQALSNSVSTFTHKFLYWQFFLPSTGRNHHFNLNQNRPNYNDLNFHMHFMYAYKFSRIQDVKSKYKQNWINHLERMDNTRLPKHALIYKPRGRRDPGRPRKRWQRVDAGTGQTT